MAQDVPVLTFRGLANASAAVALDGRYFVLADDEKPAIFLFDLKRPGGKPDKIPLGKQLGIGKKEPDLEGAAMIGSRIWWITSHNVPKKDSPSRRMLFHTDIDRSSGKPTFQVGSRIHRRLLDDLSARPSIAEALDFGGKDWKKIDIEGLAATPNGGLMLGFRAPVNERGAVVVEIADADALARGEPPDLNDPFFIDLGGRGIRSFEEIGGGYLLVAGPRKGGKTSKLFFWSGRRHDDPVPLDTRLPKTFNPEAVFRLGETRRVCVISDDGKFYRGENPLPPPPSFRAVLLELDRLLPSQAQPS